MGRGAKRRSPGAKDSALELVLTLVKVSFYSMLKLY